MGAVEDDEEAAGLFPPAAAPASPFPLAEAGPGREAPEPFAAAVAPDEIAAELEQIDFFLDQGLADDAREMVDAINPRFAEHPAFLDRRVRLEALEASDRTQPHAERIDAGFAAALLGESEQGAVPAAPIGVGREPAGPAVTPRAVISGGGAADLETHADLGIAYKEMGLWDAAVVEFNQLARDPRREVFALTMIGECHEAKGAAADAVVHYKRALNLPQVTEPESTQLYFQLGNVFQTLGDRNEALFFYEKVAKRDPQFRDVSRRISELKAAGEAGRVAAGQTRR
jgi:tetratricopeptide (TPR) repeat protein